LCSAGIQLQILEGGKKKNNHI